MADTVQRMLEGMIPELEDLEERGLFSGEEVREVVATRREWEHKLARRHSLKEDFLRYVAYEKSLDRLRAMRKKKRGIKKPGLGDRGGQRRIHFILERATRKFKGDLEIWHEAIDFAMDKSAYTVASRRLGEAMKYHPREISLWIMAAKFHFEVNGDVHTARSLLQSAIRINKNQPKLWAEYLRLEALYLYQVFKRREVLGINKLEEGVQAQGEEALLTGKILTVVYEQAIKALPESVELRELLAKTLKAFFQEESLSEIAVNLSRRIWQDALLYSFINKADLAECWRRYASFFLNEGFKKRDEIRDEFKIALEEEMFPELLEAYIEFVLENATEEKNGAKQKRRRVTRQSSSSVERSFDEQELSDILGAFSSKNFTEKALIHICRVFPSLAPECHRLKPESLQLALNAWACMEKEFKERQCFLRKACKSLSGNVQLCQRLTGDLSKLYLRHLEQAVQDGSLQRRIIMEEFEEALKWFKSNNHGGDGHLAILKGLLNWAEAAESADTVRFVLHRLEKLGVPPVLPAFAYKTVIAALRDLDDDEASIRAVYAKALDMHPQNESLRSGFWEFEKKHGSIENEIGALLRKKYY